jgi:hypothetical protein
MCHNRHDTGCSQRKKEQKQHYNFDDKAEVPLPGIKKRKILESLALFLFSLSVLVGWTGFEPATLTAASGYTTGIKKEKDFSRAFRSFSLSLSDLPAFAKSYGGRNRVVWIRTSDPFAPHASTLKS